MTLSPAWTVEEGPGSVLATAIHHGHELRAEVEARIALSETERLREEDPYTGLFTRIVPNRIVVNRSRFEFDLNRPREGAVYTGPDSAWGLNVWRTVCSDDMKRRSLAMYDRFYRELGRKLQMMTQAEGRFVVLDIHGYNYRREGREKEASSTDNPEVNVGTGSLDRSRWGALVDRFMSELSHAGGLDVRENVRFRGGHMSRWIHARYPEAGCCLALEFKKTFMDEWSGELFPNRLDRLIESLATTVPGLVESTAALVR